MKTPAVLALLGSALLVAGCASLERSRDLANPRVSPTVTAVQVCASCHGVDGNSTSPNFPRLAGQSRDYLVEQMQNFRAHHRSDPAGYEYMWGITRNLTDEQIAGLAAYFDAQKPQINARAKSALLPRGKIVFDSGVPEHGTPPCSACHGQHAEGMAGFPRLAAQHGDYLVKQLTVFQRTDQRPGTPMTQIAHSLLRPDIEAVAAYLQSMTVTN